MIAVVDHLLCHTAVDTDILACDKARHIRAKIEHHIGDVARVPYSARGLLNGICALIYGIIIVNPPGRDGIDTHLARKAYRKRVREGRDAALCRSVS